VGGGAILRPERCGGSRKSGVTTIASGFRGPADFCAFPHDGGLMVVVPDLVKSELRFIQLAP
jgi:hypothetical protein